MTKEVCDLRNHVHTQNCVIFWIPTNNVNYLNMFPWYQIFGYMKANIYLSSFILLVLRENFCTNIPFYRLLKYVKPLNTQNHENDITNKETERDGKHIHKQEGIVQAWHTHEVKIRKFIHAHKLAKSHPLWKILHSSIFLSPLSHHIHMQAHSH